MAVAPATVEDDNDWLRKRPQPHAHDFLCTPPRTPRWRCKQRIRLCWWTLRWSRPRCSSSNMEKVFYR
ncbi:hypothetical protein BS78_02G161700 [Paspalum vaginatum]|nr:hypothetical protein BS78_02G161700 [Paspalum vaginatum]